MKVRVTVEMSAEDVKALQRAGRLTAGLSAHDALQEEIEALLTAHIQDMEGEADLAKQDYRVVPTRPAGEDQA